MSNKVPLVVVGGGIVGSTIAYELSNSIDDIIVLEKDKQLNNQSTRNSGVIHAGIYYQNAPLKAKYCVEGNKLLYKFSQKNNIAHIKTGKLVVATNEREEKFLNYVKINAQENNILHSLLSGKQARSRDKNINAKSALYLPTSGIIDSVDYLNTIKGLSEQRGVIFANGNQLVNIEKKGNNYLMQIKNGNQIDEIEAEFIINAAGLYSDDIAKMLNPDSRYIIEPIKGESAKFYRKNFDGLNVYPTPYGIDKNGNKLDLSFTEFEKQLREGNISQSVGCHITPTLGLDGKLSSEFTIGPVSVGNINKEDYSHVRNIEYFFNMIHEFYPGIKREQIQLHQTGIRAKLKDHNDFVIDKGSNYVNLTGIDSPGLTASLAIAKDIKRFYDGR